LLCDNPPYRALLGLHESISLTTKFDLPTSLTNKYMGGKNAVRQKPI
jgi:hypothetical protein